MSVACTACITATCASGDPECGQNAIIPGGACYKACGGGQGKTAWSTDPKSGVQIECRAAAKNFFNRVFNDHITKNKHDFEAEAESTCNPVDFKSKPGNYTAQAVFHALGIRSTLYNNPKGKTWREEVLDKVGTDIDRDDLSFTAKNKQRCMHNQFTDPDNHWGTANYDNLADRVTRPEYYEETVGICKKCPSAGKKRDDGTYVKPSEKECSPFHPVDPVDHHIPAHNLNPPCAPGDACNYPLYMPNAYLFELEDPTTQANKDGQQCYIAVNGKVYCRKPMINPNDNVPINPDDRWDDLYQEFEAFLSEFNWSVHGFTMFAASIPVAGYAAYKAGRPELAVVYTGGGAVAPLAYRVAREEYTQLTIDWAKYHAVIEAAVPLGAAVVAVMGEAALGIPSVIQGYTMLAGVVVAAGTFAYEELKEIF